MNKNNAILTGLYAITDSALMPGERLMEKTEAELRGGCRILQYRNKNANSTDRKREAGLLRTLCHRYQSLLIINDDMELALQVGADGIHIGQSDTSLAQVRKQVGDQIIVGISCHDNITLALQAQQGGASYVAFGRFFESHTKPHAPAADVAVLSRAKKTLKIPIVAIGGITRDNAMRVITQGADMIAVIHDLFSPNDVHEIEQRARTFARLFS